MVFSTRQYMSPSRPEGKWFGCICHSKWEFCFKKSKFESFLTSPYTGFQKRWESFHFVGRLLQGLREKKFKFAKKVKWTLTFNFLIAGASAARTLQGSIDLWLCINIRFNKKYNNNFQVLYLPFLSFMLKIENYQDWHMILYI